MKYFTEDYIDFFKELGNNNNKEWFHSQKKRYEESVKKPFASFVTAVISEIQKYDNTLAIEAKDCILRINRDIRFAKDKTPYNLHCTAIISNGGRKDKSIPGLFLRLSPEMIGVMGGAYILDKNQLEAIRKRIGQDINAFQKVINNKSFVEKFGSIKGEKHKRVSKEIQEIAEQEPLVMNKQFYFMAELSPELIPSDQLMPEIMKHWKASRGVNGYFSELVS